MCIHCIRVSVHQSAFCSLPSLSLYLLFIYFLLFFAQGRWRRCRYLITYDPNTHTHTNCASASRHNVKATKSRSVGAILFVWVFEMVWVIGDLRSYQHSLYTHSPWFTLFIITFGCYEKLTIGCKAKYRSLPAACTHVITGKYSLKRERESEICLAVHFLFGFFFNYFSVRLPNQ